jgi:hypothetical protein
MFETIRNVRADWDKATPAMHKAYIDNNFDITLKLSAAFIGGLALAGAYALVCAAMEDRKPEPVKPVPPRLPLPRGESESLWGF